jgi:hypothetical protein
LPGRWWTGEIGRQSKIRTGISYAPDGGFWASGLAGTAGNRSTAVAALQIGEIQSQQIGSMMNHRS